MRLCSMVACLGLVGAVGCMELIDWGSASARARSLEQPPPLTTPHALHARWLAFEAEDPRSAAWNHQAHACLAWAIPLTLPSREAVWVSGILPEAVAYRFDARRGHRLVVEIEHLQAADASASGTDLVFVDVFDDDQHDGSVRLRHPIASGSSAEALSCSIERDGSYLLRLQPSLGVVGRLVVHARLEPSMAFPVAGKDPRSVASTFGAPRDGGRRRHHGIDIFAARGTQVLAAVDSTVLHVGTNRLGGNVVWLRSDAHPLVLYYAHLEQAHVRSGQHIEVGSVLGTVGNTGNARSTAPHLHFGIYGRGPLDPFPFVARARERTPALRVDPERLGRWLQVSNGGTRVRERPDPRSPMVATLSRGAPVLLKGGRGASYRIELPDGTAGWLPASRVRPWTDRRFAARLTGSTPLLAAPTLHAPTVTLLDETSAIIERATWGDYRLIESRSGDVGWISTLSTQAMSDAGSRGE